MSEPVRVHLRVPGTSAMPDLMKLIQSIESAGFDGAGILDSQMLSRDTFVVRNLYLMPLLTFAPPDSEIAAFRDTVFPRLSAAGVRPALLDRVLP